MKCEMHMTLTCHGMRNEPRRQNVVQLSKSSRLLSNNNPTP